MCAHTTAVAARATSGASTRVPAASVPPHGGGGWDEGPFGVCGVGLLRRVQLLPWETA